MHPLASREPLQMGAEIYGDADFAADREVLDLAVRSARVIGGHHVQVDLGNTAVVRSLLGAGLHEDEGTDAILAALTGKDPAALAAASAGCPARVQAALRSLIDLNGGLDVLEQAQRELPPSAALDAALDELAQLAQGCGADEVSIDLADLHGFRYHTGATFAVYVAGLSGPLLRGGRYDDIGLAFGRARPATGFSLLDLREAAQLARPSAVHAIRAPRSGDAGLASAVQALRDRGEVVINAGPGGELGVALVVDRELVWEQGQWRVRSAAASPGSSLVGTG